MRKLKKKKAFLSKSCKKWINGQIYKIGFSKGLLNFFFKIFFQILFYFTFHFYLLSLVFFGFQTKPKIFKNKKKTNKCNIKFEKKKSIS